MREMWEYLVDGTRVIIGVADDLLFEQLPYVFDRYFTQLPLWAVGLTLTLLTAVTVFISLAPTRRGDMTNTGAALVANFAVKASKGIFTLGFYGSIMMVFAILFMRHMI